MRREIILRIEDDLLEEIDEQRGDVPRNTWITRACEDALESSAPQRARVAPEIVRHDETAPPRPKEQP